MSHRLSILGPGGRSISIVAAGSGPPLMLLHGFPLDHRLWKEQLDHLADRYHVIAPEFRGFGDSTLGEQSYSMSDLAQDVELIRRHLAADQPIFLCGLSMGGYVALEYWAHYPQHLRGLCLTNTKPDSDNAGGKQARMEMARQAQTEGTKAAVGTMLDKLLSSHSRMDRALRDTVEAMMFSIPPASIQAAQQAMAARRDFTTQLKAIQVPTLVLTGSEDSIASVQHSQAWAAEIPHSTFREIPHAGHLCPLENHQAFNLELSRFLQDINHNSE